MISVRRATHADAPAICAMHVDCIRRSCANDYTPEQIEAWAGPKKPENYTSALDKGETMFVAEVDGTIVGFGAMRQDKIVGMYIAPEFQRRGIGQRLLATLESDARLHGIEILTLHSTLNALAFYKSQGFIAGERIDRAMQGVAVPCVRMTKDLRRHMSRRTEWQKIKISDEAFESAGVFDVNNDGRLDIVSGGYWYEGPAWKKHKLCDVGKYDEYYDDFSTIALDINGDGYLDFVTGGWWGNQLVWRENPKGDTCEWKTHVIEKMGNIETTRAWDVDGDGELEIVPNTPGEGIKVFKLIRDANGKGTGKFQRFDITAVPQGHGLGFGDLLGDGKPCFIVNNGFWQATGDPLKDPWTFHPEFDFGRMASVPILVADVDGDGMNELIVGQAHGYGLHYWKRHNQPDGSRKWTRHAIDPYFSQYHELHWVDIDNDGQKELITGNRYRAHCGHEEGETEVVGLYCFKWNGEFFTKQVIDHGTVPHASGTGIFMTIIDIDGDGRLDIVAPGKEGLYLFKNLGPEQVGIKK
jgi:ribosomal protein S18 acetylase RimI-like enzyme